MLYKDGVEVTFDTSCVVAAQFGRGARGAVDSAGALARWRAQPHGLVALGLLTGRRWGRSSRDTVRLAQPPAAIAVGARLASALGAPFHQWWSSVATAALGPCSTTPLAPRSRPLRAHALPLLVPLAAEPAFRRLVPTQCGRCFSSTDAELPPTIVTEESRRARRRGQARWRRPRRLRGVRLFANDPDEITCIPSSRNAAGGRRRLQPRRRRREAMVEQGAAARRPQRGARGARRAGKTALRERAPSPPPPAGWSGSRRLRASSRRRSASPSTRAARDGRRRRGRGAAEVVSTAAPSGEDVVWTMTTTTTPASGGV